MCVQLTLILMNRGQSKVMTLTEQQKKAEKQKKLEATLPSVRGNARDIDPVLLNVRTMSEISTLTLISIRTGALYSTPVDDSAPPTTYASMRNQH